MKQIISAVIHLYDHIHVWFVMVLMNHETADNDKVHEARYFVNIIVKSHIQCRL